MGFAAIDCSAELINYARGSIKEGGIPMNQRKTYIDMAKGVGILLVIFGHAMTGENRIVSWQCTFFMPMFFICSGLCYSKPKTILENTKKILIPYYIGGGLAFV